MSTLPETGILGCWTRGCCGAGAATTAGVACNAALDAPGFAGCGAAFAADADGDAAFTGVGAGAVRVPTVPYSTAAWPYAAKAATALGTASAMRSTTGLTSVQDLVIDTLP